MNARLPALIVSLLMGFVAGCGPATEAPSTRPGSANGPAAPEGRQIMIVARDMRYEPAEITVRPGEAVRILLQNEGQAPHNIEFKLPDGEKKLPSNLQPFTTGVLTFTAPEEPGRYEFYCPVGDHAEQGMKGTLIVAAPE